MLLQTALFDISTVSDSIENRFSWAKASVNYDFLIAALQNYMLKAARVLDSKKRRIKALHTGCL